jgi:hypothetical protein
MGPNAYLAAVACFVLAAACSFVGVAIRRTQGGQSTGDARLAAAMFRFAMLSGAVFSLARDCPAVQHAVEFQPMSNEEGEPPAPER